MREQYAGREVSVAAVDILFDELRRMPGGNSALEHIDPQAQRISWDQLCELLAFTATQVPDVRTIGAAGLVSATRKYRSRAWLARRVFTLEDALRLILFPRNPIDFACMNAAVTAEPGRVDVVGYLFDRFQVSDTFFEVMLGAAQEFVHQLDLPGAKVSMQTDGRQAHFVFTYTTSNGFIDRVRRFVSSGLHSVYSMLIIRSSYPDLVYRRKLFEEQLIERANIEEELTQSERAFERRIEQTGDIIAEWGDDERLLYVSPNLPRLMGSSVKEFLEDPQKVMHEDDFNRLREGVLQALHQRIPVRVDDFRAMNADGDLRWCEANLSPFEALDGSPRALGVIRDITERRRFFAERQKLDRELEQTQRLEMVGVLAGGIAHDFNNLLMPILGYAELAQTELNDPIMVRERLNSIAEAAAKASDLVKDLMSYAGTEPSAFVLVDLVLETRGLFGLINASIPANVELQVDLDDSALVSGDASQLGQVIMNLIINAAEAIGDEKGTIELSVQSRDGAVVLSVRDDGCGMDEVIREHAFEPFYTTKFAGRGLGLSAVSGIVRAHDAELNVATESGRGTTVQITLAAATGQVIEVVLPPTLTGDVSGCVLLVDDDAAVREVGKDMLEGMGYEVELASDGAEALEMLNGREYSAMVLDLVMPRTDGREVLAALREQHSRLPVIMVSGYGAGQIGEDIESDGYARFLSKPVRPPELMAALQELTAS